MLTYASITERDEIRRFFYVATNVTTFSLYQGQAKIEHQSYD